MVGWHHQLDGHEFEQALGDGEGLGSLACCSLWGCKESDMTEQLNKRQRKGFSCGSVVKKPPANARDLGSLPELGRSSEEGNGSPFQYSCLGNPMDSSLGDYEHGIMKNQT